MSTGSVSEEEVAEVSTDEEVEEREMEEVKEEDVKNGEVEELEEPLVRIVVTQRAKVNCLWTFLKQTTKSSLTSS